MAIPNLEGSGLLPAGEHVCDLDEVEGMFAHNARRADLFRQLRPFRVMLEAQGLGQLPLYVDGSFSTSKDHPGDIDVVLDLTDATDEQEGSAFRLFALSHSQIKEEFSVDFYLFHPIAEKDLRAFFQYVRIEVLNARGLPPETRKGILRVVA
jgi:hypothetical protein